MNRLSNEKSAYLKHSSSQKIDWYPWSEEAFEKAKQEDKPVFLSSGAIWCHWCHVMAGECFADDGIADLLNEYFVCIKLDRDERPEVDRRYQHAVAAMGHGGGWPLSVFLTPDKKPFFGGTYFPPEDRGGRPGFRKVLEEVARFYRSKRDEITKFTDRLIEFLQPEPMMQEEIQKNNLEQAVESILSEYDAQNGGFGASPKFPMPGAVEFLMNRYFLTGNKAIGFCVKKTLEAMAKGGFHDQLGGGFHRYSTDEAWIIPHFEKMADDNAWLLRNYIDAYSLFGNKYFKDVAEGIIAFTGDVLSDPDGGFYSSQDADVTPEDEGGYFTWKEEDFRRILNDEEFMVLSLHFFNDRGSMQHDGSKKVLFDAMGAEEIAAKTGKELIDVIEIINTGRGKLLRERMKRESPFIDRILYTSLNGMMISSYLKAYRVLKDGKMKDFALKSLQKIRKKHLIDTELYHSEGVKAVLDDYIYLIDAFIAAYEVTGEQSYLSNADELMEICIKKFRDNNEGGFLDSEEEILDIRIKGIEDIPHPSANAVAVILMLKLYHMTGKEEYHQSAESALKVFSAKARDMGIHSGYYYCALDAYFNMLKLDMHTKSGSELAEAALESFIPYSSFVYSEDKGYIVPCKNNICYEPVERPDSLRIFLEKR
ncbi:MAG: thioredoxin domain-containing protein [Nitrospirota bacterium]